MTDLLAGYEAAFLRMKANRVLNYARKAAEAGETYRDLSAPADLNCGAKAKIVFEDTAGRYLAVAEIWPAPHLDDAALTELASQILRTPAVERSREPNGKRVYVPKDAT